MPVPELKDTLVPAAPPAPGDAFKLSVVTTMYKSTQFVREFWRRASEQASRITGDYEIVFVNDGSPDDSLAVALELFREDEHVVVVDLARNFGHHRAMVTGLAHASGDYVFLVDCDLEEKPELIADFWEQLQQAGVDVVYGIQETRKGGLFERASGALFYRLFNAMSPVAVLPNVATVRLMTRRYVQSLLTYREREISLLGLWALAGYDQLPRPFRKAKRPGSSYSLRARIAIAVNSITSFTNTPLVLVFYLGFVISLVAILTALGLVIFRLFRPFAAGWPSVIVSVWLLGGLTILSLGIIGIYLAKVFSETKQRPFTTIRGLHTHDAVDSSSLET